MWHNIQKRRRGVVIGTLAVAATGITSVAFALGVLPNNGNPNVSSPVGAAADYAAGNRLPASNVPASVALKQVMDGLTGTRLRSIEIAPGQTDEEPSGPVGITVTVDGLSAEDVEAKWLAAIAQGAMADLMRGAAETTQSVSGGAIVVGVDGNGLADRSELGVGYVASGQHFVAVPDAALRQRIARVASTFGLEVHKVSILHPLDTALWVEFTVPNDGPVSWSISELQSALEGTPRNLEGIGIRLFSATGETLLTTSGAYRSGLGSLSFATGQDERFGAAHG